MTKNEIIKMATNSDIQYYMEKIKYLHDNIFSMTQCEVNSAQRKIKEYTQEIKMLLKEE